MILLELINKIIKYMPRTPDRGIAAPAQELGGEQETKPWSMDSWEYPETLPESITAKIATLLATDDKRLELIHSAPDNSRIPEELLEQIIKESKTIEDLKESIAADLVAIHPVLDRHEDRVELYRLYLGKYIPQGEEAVSARVNAIKDWIKKFLPENIQYELDDIAFKVKRGLTRRFYR